MKEVRKQEIPIPFKLDDFFSTQEERDEENKEKIEEIDISLIDNFKNHPFKVIKNNEFDDLVESINNNGLMNAVIVRKKENGRYEMISGHRRLEACKKLGIKNIPTIIKDLDDDEATIYMVDSNLHRERLLPSERAFAYKMKLDALNHQGKRNDLTLPQDGTRLRSDEIIANEYNSSRNQIQRYIRLTNLIPEILNLVDNSETKESPSIAITPAVEISYLTKEEQKLLYEYIDYNLITPNHSQSIKLKELSKKNLLNKDSINNIMNELKPNQINKFKIDEEQLYKVLPKNISKEKIEPFILKACEYYSKYLRNIDRAR